MHKAHTQFADAPTGSYLWVLSNAPRWRVHVPIESDSSNGSNDSRALRHEMQSVEWAMRRHADELLADVGSLGFRERRTTAAADDDSDGDADDRSVPGMADGSALGESERQGKQNDEL